MKRPITWAVVFIICGIYMRLGASAMMFLASFLVCLLTISRFAIIWRNFRYAAFLLLVIFGFLLAEMGTHGDTEALAGKEVLAEGVIRETGTTNSGNQKLALFGDLRDETGAVWKGCKVYVIWDGEETLAVGDRVRLCGTAEGFSHASYPGGYDEKMFLETKRFLCKLFPETVEITGRDTSLFTKLAAARLRLHGILEKVLPAEECGVMKALLTGERDDIDKEVRELYTKAGVVHILCISGLHMSTLAMYIAFFLEKICKRSMRASAVLTIAASLGFLSFVGPTPSSVRAVTMVAVVMLGRIFFRVDDRLNSIGIAALLILAIQPRYLWNAGFQLSFLTVIGLCAAERDVTPGASLLEKLKAYLRLSLYASLFSFPVAAYHFSGVSLAGILGNIVILPLSGFLLGAGILSVVLGFFWIPAGIFAAGSVYAILQIYKATCLLLLKLPFGYILTGRPSLVVILLYYAILLLALHCGGKRGFWKKAAVLGVAMWCAVFENALFRRENTVAFLDVGQGDAAVVSTYDGKAYLVDGGGVYGLERGKNKGAAVVLPYLETLGICEIEAAFLSHPDSDHMTGVLEAMDEMRVKTLVLPEYPFEEGEEMENLREALENTGTPLRIVKAGDISSDGRWECLYPLEGVAFRDGDDNHGSMVLRYSYGGTEVLFTGDIGSLDEELLMEKGTPLSADILKVSHHGSKYASGTEFLREVSPRTAVISCGRKNLYGHPAAETLERLEDAAAQTYRTDRDGAVILTLSPKGGWKEETTAGQKPFYERMREK